MDNLEDRVMTQENDQETQPSTSMPEEEDECRVCRGPAEEGSPLFHPCKCSGSIGLTHQDCLVSWLEVTRGDGRCELCKTKFRFDPQYAENTPDRLPPYEVLLGLSSRFLAKWLPLGFRIVLAFTLWLGIAPLLTACLYNGWIHRPSFIVKRLSKELIPGDIVTGAILVAIIVISFLSIMSFADFLRIHWAEPNEEARQRQNGQNRDDDEIVDSIPDEDLVEEAVIDILETYSTRASQQAGPNDPSSHDTTTDESGHTKMKSSDLVSNGDYRESQANTSGRLLAEQVAREVNEQHVGFPWNLNERDDSDSNENDMLDDNNNPNGDNLINEPIVEPRVPDVQRPFDPLDPGFQEEQVDMEVNVALDELLGIRGPISTLIRNLLWLLAFNATYLGFFAFVPRTVGNVVYGGLLNTTSSQRIFKSLPLVYSDESNTTSIQHLVTFVDKVSSEADTTFRLPDIATIGLGYLSIALVIVILRYGRIFSERVRQAIRGEKVGVPTKDEGAGFQINRGDGDGARRANANAFGHLGNRNEEGIEVVIGFGAALDTLVAVVKVGILLFLKMCVLPIFLGLALDASTAEFFEKTLEDRLIFAGSDLFSFALLHWVAGITFMLLVTVFLLQLREVVHPDLLASVIRPQEPQPDLLGNLMKETVFTHIKRMILSLAIYTPILLIHVTLPIQIFLRCGISIELSFWHMVKAEMQRPMELIVFHLSMLALLERYKNAIGQMQHFWMKHLCRFMGITDYLLPLSVEKFKLIGTKRIFTKDCKGEICIDSFWYELAECKGDIDVHVRKNIQTQAQTIDEKGTVMATGERVYSSRVRHIRLPRKSDDKEKGTLLPTTLGRYRLNLRDKKDSELSVEFWCEVYGNEVSRPPEGWDDLGAGGAFKQGRWAWGKEKRSPVENSLATRNKIQDPISQKRPLCVLAKLAILFMLTWVAITMAIVGSVASPLMVGRFLYFLFRFEAKSVHDPWAFVLGGALFYPGVILLYSIIEKVRGRGQLHDWIFGFKMPPKQKAFCLSTAIILWFGVAPVALGLTYEIGTVKSCKWFDGKELISLDATTILLAWMTGSAFLNIWAFFGYFGVFSHSFWANIGNGILEPPIDENGNPQQARNNVNTIHENTHGWQGKQGRIAQFFRIWKEALLDRNWDKVEKTTLLYDFAVPISRQLLSTLVGSTLSFLFITNLMHMLTPTMKGYIHLPLFGEVERGFFRCIAFRLSMITHILVQLCSSFRAEIDEIFEAAHAAARNDRYLIGEVLMNYDRTDR